MEMIGRISLQSQKKMTMGNRGAGPAEDVMTAFSALHFLHNYNQIFTPTGNSFIPGCNPYAIGNAVMEMNHVQRDSRILGDWSPVLGAFQPYLSSTPSLTEAKGRILLAQARRPRGEKKPIPDEQKDDRYYERRKRNNQAAKKSRDARKFREDQTALRAALLERENSVLRAQVLTLREETQSLRQLLFIQGKSMGKNEDGYPRIVDYCETGISANEKSE